MQNASSQFVRIGKINIKTKRLNAAKANNCNAFTMQWFYITISFILHELSRSYSNDTGHSQNHSDKYMTREPQYLLQTSVVDSEGLRWDRNRSVFQIVGLWWCIKCFSQNRFLIEGLKRKIKTTDYRLQCMVTNFIWEIIP